MAFDGGKQQKAPDTHQQGKQGPPRHVADASAIPVAKIISSLGLRSSMPADSMQGMPQTDQDENERSTRIATIRAIGVQAKHADLKLLQEALQDSSWQVRTAAIMTLGKQKEPVFVSQLFDCLQDADETVRAAAVRTIGEQQGQDMPVEPLVLAMQDSSWQVREAAVFALGKRGDAVAIDLIAKARSDEDFLVSDAAEHVLQQLDRSSSKSVLTAEHFAIASWNELQSDVDEREDSARSPVEKVHNDPTLIAPLSFEKGSNTSEREALHGANGNQTTHARTSSRRRRTTSSVPGRLRSVRRVLRSNRHLEYALVAVVLLGILLPWWLLTRPVQPPGTASSATAAYSFSSVQNQKVSNMSWSPDGERLASVTENGSLYIWDVKANSALSITHHEQVFAMIWLSDGLHLARAASNGGIEIVRVNEGSEVQVLLQIPEVAADDRTHAVWAPDGQRIAFYHEDEASVTIWRIAQSQNSAEQIDASTCKSDVQPVHVVALAWTPDGTNIAVATDDGEVAHEKTICVWQTVPELQIRDKQGEADTVMALSWSPDGKRLAHVNGRGEVWIWDQSTPEEFVLNPPRSYLPDATAFFNPALVWSPDGKWLAATTATGAINVWDTISGIPIFIYEGHKKSLNSLAWSSTNQYVASADSGGMIQVWNIVLP